MYLKNQFYFLILITGSVLMSCAPQTKESYMEDYKQFISEVSAKCEEYTDEDWEKADEKNDKFQNEWYDKFEDEFTWKDEALILKYNLLYNMAKVPKTVDDLKEIFSTDEDEDEYNELKERINSYVDKDMKRDLDILIKHLSK